MTEANTATLKPYDLGYPTQTVDVDLGTFAEAYNGIRITILANPHQRFRREFAVLTTTPGALESGHTLRDLLGVVFGAATVADLNAVLDTLPVDALRWLVYPSIREDEHVTGRPPQMVPAGLFAEWDAWVSSRIKARATRLEPLPTENRQA